jgi:chromosome segregation ATPase
MLGIHGEEMRRARSPNVSEESMPKRKKVNEANHDLDSTQDMLNNIPQCSSQDLKEYDEKVSRSASCGILEKIRLVNFMCHKRLEVDFNSNVNFIHGRNGSGKSAIMTGVVAGLGGKASATSRGSSMKGFVRTGASFAEVTIWLRNTGVDSYRPEVYGKSIEIIRRINLDGTGSYRIKSSRNNATVSTKKEELLCILDQFNIQVDNPVSLLNQDTSRNFLHVTDSRAKYKLFMKATLLDHIASECEKTEQSNQRHKEIIDSKEEEIKYEQRGIKELEEQWKGFEKLREMEGRIADLKKELQWAYVSEIEKVHTYVRTYVCTCISIQYPVCGWVYLNDSMCTYIHTVCTLCM